MAKVINSLSPFQKSRREILLRRNIYNEVMRRVEATDWTQLMDTGLETVEAMKYNKYRADLKALLIPDDISKITFPDRPYSKSFREGFHNSRNP